MTELLKRNAEIKWTLLCEDNFCKLKRALTQAPILKLIDYTKDELVLCTDASEEATGAVLMQEGHVVAYESRKLNLVYQNYPTHEKELSAIVDALKIWRHYFLGRHFRIKMDHANVRFLTA